MTPFRIVLLGLLALGGRAATAQPAPPDAAPWWRGAVFYEVFVRSFADSDGDGIGDLRGLTDRLDYLNDGDPATTTDLGVTGLWLMPIHPSPSYHGYDVTDYRGVHPDYGTRADVRRLLAEAHRRGIRVVVDFVMNHSSRRHPWFVAAERGDPAFRPFYRWAAEAPAGAGPWGQRVWHGRPPDHYYGVFSGGMPDLNYATDAVRDSVFAAADFWLRDVGVDGFRLDAVKYVFEEGDSLENTARTVRFWAGFEARVTAARPDAFTVCEAWDAAPVAARYVAAGGFDACFEFDLAGALLDAVRRGDARRLRARVAAARAAYPGDRFATFLTNHDQPRVMTALGGDEPRARAAAALLLTLPGTPFVYYGEEVGLAGAKPDPDIRRPMPWTAGAGAGFTTGTPWRPPAADYATRNVAAQTGDPASLLHHYRTLVGLRNREPALRLGDYADVASPDTAVMAFVRRHEGRTVLVVVNTGPRDVRGLTLGLPAGVAPGAYRLDDLVAGGARGVRVGPGGAVTGLAVPPFGARIFRLRPAGGGRR